MKWYESQLIIAFLFWILYNDAVCGKTKNKSGKFEKINVTYR